MRSLLKLKPYLRPYIWHLVGSALLAIPLAGIRLGPAPVIRYTLDIVLVRKDVSKLIYFPIALIGLYLFNFVIRFSHYYLLRIVIVRVNQKIKGKIFKHLLGLSADYFTAQSTGTLLSRTASDPQYIDSGLSCINIVFREPITLLLLFGYALKINWRLTLITLILAPLLALIFSATGRRLKRYVTRITDINSALFSTLQESFAGIRIIKIFGLEKYAYNKFFEQNEEYAQLALKTSLIEEISHPLIELLSAFALGPLIYYGGLQVLVGKMSPGELFSFFAAFALMMNPIRMLNEVNLKLNQASSACERIFQIFDWKPNLREPQFPRKISNIRDSIQLKDVSFAYPDTPSRLVLDHVNFTLRQGQVIAVVGSSGAGKSSLVSLLPRIFDVTSGSIQIDGFDTRDFALADLRKLIAIVSQEVFLFNDTIEANIRCGHLGATSHEIKEAAKRAHALEFIENLPDGFQSIIGDRGQKLSGGERQRLSIARAFLSRAPFLILDEATSSLDTASERAVQSAIDELMINRTTLIIAHRLSTIRHADLILVLKEGKIVETGVHHELINLGGEYASFHPGT